MEIYKDENTGMEYVDFEDILDENIEIDNITKLIINSIILDYLGRVSSKFISLECAISTLKAGILTHDEVVQLKYQINELYFDVGLDYFDYQHHDGIWKYIKNYSIEDLYNDATQNSNIKLSEIFENDDFLKNIMQIKEDKFYE